MKALDPNTRTSQIGLLLLILGGLALLSNIGLFRGFGNVVGAALFAIGGALFLRLEKHRPGRIFGLLAAFALFGIAGAMIGGKLAGGLFLGILGCGFAAVYANYRRHWWAIIPAGVLLTLGLVAALDVVLPGLGSGSILFVGFAATFALLTRLPQYPQKWAIYPALALAVVAVLVLTTGGGWLFPFLLVGAGLYLMSRRQGGSPEVSEPSGSNDLVVSGEDAIVPAPTGVGAPAVAPSRGIETEERGGGDDALASVTGADSRAAGAPGSDDPAEADRPSDAPGSDDPADAERPSDAPHA